MHISLVSLFTDHGMSFYRTQPGVTPPISCLLRPTTQQMLSAVSSFNVCILLPKHSFPTS